MATRPRLFGDYLQRPSEVWQLALDRAPLPVLDDDDQPFLPQVAICLNVERDQIEMSAPTARENEDGAAIAREALRRGARDWRVKPARVLTEDAELADALRAELAAEGVEIEARPELAEIRGVIAKLQATLVDPEMVPDLLSGEGVTLAQAGAFAEAARQFAERAPWRWLSDEDLIQVESPELGEGLRYLCVMGAGGDQHGLLFFDTAEQWEEAFDFDPEERMDQSGYWAVSIDPPADALSSDVALWLRHELPRTGDGRIPVALFFDRDDPRRPDARTLAFFEGALSALASITEEEVDSGRFERAVLTHRGPATFVLSLPELLAEDRWEDDLDPEEDEIGPEDLAEEVDEADRVPSQDEPEEGIEGIGRRLRQVLAAHDFETLDEAREFLRKAVAAGEMPAEDLTPEETRAYEMLELASEGRGRRRIQLARKAIELYPDFADGYSFLGHLAGDAATSLHHYEQALAAAERSLDPEIFEDEVGGFWLLDETRPYLRARLGIAEALRELDRPEEAAAQYQEILRFDDTDHTGSRYELADLYFELGRLETLGELLDRFADDRFAYWSFSRALLQFRLHGDSPAALRALRTACQSNPYVPVYLLGEKELPEELLGFFTPGTEEEAAHYANDALEAWEEADQALDWLAAYAPPPPRPDRPKGRRKGGKGGKDRASGSKRKR